jgi:hypothetical protein
MRIGLILAAVLMATPALAQQTKVPETYTIVMTPQEVDQIYVILIERPYKDVERLLLRLKEQVQAQQIRAANPPAADPDKK